MVYFDMDGVLAKYDITMYSSDKSPMWNEKGSHCFANCEVDETVYNIVESLAKAIGDDIYILTSVSSKSIEVRNEQILDKMKWIADNYPMLNLCNFMACESDKRNTISRIKGISLTKKDILIDDYNKNLYSWKSSGGTAIKYCNGINSVGAWPGPYISYKENIQNSVTAILKIWYNASN